LKKLQQKMNAKQSGSNNSHGYCHKLRGTVVDVINPSFKTFNRPLLLALIVVAATVACFTVLLVFMLTRCEKNSFGGTPTQLARLLESSNVCIDSVAKLSTSDEHGTQLWECLFAPSTDLTIYDINHPVLTVLNNGGTEGEGDHGMGGRVKDMTLPRWTDQVVPLANYRQELAPLRKSDAYCEGSLQRVMYWGEGSDYDNTSLTWLQRVAEERLSFDLNYLWADQCDVVTWQYSMNSKCRSSNQWSHKEENDQLCPAGTVCIAGTCAYQLPVLELAYRIGRKVVWAEPYLQAEYTRCPLLVIVAGAALGYGEFIWLGATITIITFLMMCGVLRNKRKPFVDIIIDVLKGSPEEREPIEQTDKPNNPRPVQPQPPRSPAGGSVLRGNRQPKIAPPGGPRDERALLMGARPMPLISGIGQGHQSACNDPRFANV